MNMSSANLERLTAEFPRDAEAVRRLMRFLEEVARHDREETVLTVRRIFDVAHPSSQRVLAQILQRLIQEGVLQEIISIESSELGSIGQYHSLSEVPEVVHNRNKDVDVSVRPEDLRLYYKLSA